MKNDVLNIKDLSISFGGLKAVDNLSCSIKENEIYGLIGPNGAGKTTVFNCITQFYKSNEGSVLFTDAKGQSHELTSMNVHNVIKLGLARTFQNVEVIKELKVIDNILIGAHSQFKSGIISNALRLPKAVKEEKLMREKAMKVLKYVGLENYADEYAGGQPYGILKMIEVGRTLMSNPRLIILDEPAAGLNDTETQEMAELIKRIRKDYNCSILLVEHDMRLVMSICDRICAICFGKMLVEGTIEEVQNNKDVQDAYLGKEDE